jgi:signal transduction histidine kinase
MKRIIRIVGFTFALLLLFLVAIVFTNAWLRRQNEQLQRDTLRARATQLAALLDLSAAGPPPWSPEFHHKLGQALGAEIVLLDPTAAPADAGAAPAGWRFEHVVRDADGRPAARLEVRLAPPATVRATVMFQRIGAILFALALLLLAGLVLLVVVDRRWLAPETASPDSAPAASPSEYNVLSQLAERSVRQSAELEQEREERQHAEADAHLKQILLNRALQEKIDMGRDLHDGLIQSLYATGLTIQAGRKALDQDPPAARARIESALQTLNAAIREVRTYIAGLGPDQLRQRSFADSVRAIVENLSAVREIATDLRIDEDAVLPLTSNQVTDLLQIIREALSNSLRHGHAKQISVRLHRNGAELCLLVHDDGRGFDPQLIARGHGLDNMQARADRLGATLRCQSEPGQGTRLVLTLTAPASPARP